MGAFMFDTHQAGGVLDWILAPLLLLHSPDTLFLHVGTLGTSCV